MVVVLPALLGPRRPRAWPGSMLKLISSTAVVEPNRLVRWLTDSTLDIGLSFLLQDERFLM